MPMKTLLCLSAMLLLLCPASALAAPAATLTPTGGAAFADRQAGAGPGTFKAYTVRNTGDGPLSVSAVDVVGSDFSVSLDACAGVTLAMNATCTARVTFGPETAGPKSATVRVQAAGATATASATGTARDLRATPALLDLGRARAGAQSGEGTLTLRNAAPDAYTLGAVTVSGSAFTIITNSCTGRTLATDGTCALSFRGQNASPAVTTSTVSLAGLSPAPASVRLESTQPAGSLAPVTASWGRSAATKTFTVRNTASEPLVTEPAELVGPDAAAFAISRDGCAAAPVPVDGTCEVDVSFAAAHAGYATAGLRVRTEAGGQPLRARLDAFGDDSALGTDPLSVPFSLDEQPLAALQGDGGDFHGQGLASGACDVNDDGYDDVLSGAPTWSRFPVTLSREGAAYVSFGGPTFGSRDLGSAGPAQRTLRIEGALPNSNAGAGIACAGDVNGDGVDDLVVGSWAYDYPDHPVTGSRGIAHVIFGSKELGSTSPIDTGVLGGRGFAVVAPDATDFDHLGFAVDGVGDVDGDGRDDVALLGNTATVTGTANRGVTVVIAGRAGTADVDAGTDALMRINAGPPGPAGSTSSSGQALDIAGLGDVDGDGTPDIGVAQYTAVFAGRSTASGAAWIVSGKERGTVELGDVTNTIAVVGGPHAGHRFGSAIEEAGDVNGDGLADVLIGADSTSGANSDAAYVVYGKRNGTGEVLDAAALGDRGYRLLGGPGDSTGFGVAGIGDLNGDGLDDAAVGRYAAGTNGAVSVVYGVADPTTLPANGPGSGLAPQTGSDTTRYVSLDALTSEQGATIDGTARGDRFGRQVANVGDVDGNGADDLAIGADQALRFGRTGAGEVSVALMRGPRPAAPPVGQVDPGPGPSPGPSPGPGTPAGPVVLPGGATLLFPAPAASGGKAATPRPSLAKRGLRVSRTGRVAFVVTCAKSGPRCRGSVRLTLAGGQTGRLGYTVAAGSKRTVRLRLRAAQRRSVRRNATLVGRLRVSADIPGSRAVVRTLRVRIARV